MSFDAHSRERLEALGRRLPEKLPSPLPAPAGSPPSEAAPPGRGSAPARHLLETEQSPEDLFRALMQASPDGSVPPHLLERLRGLEHSRPLASSSAPGPVSPSAPRSRNASGGAVEAGARRPKASRRGQGAPRRSGDPAQGDLYAAFDDLLYLEADSDPDPAPSPQRPAEVPAEGRLLPRPTLRQPRPGS